jgi:hypothetical protein
MTRDVAEARPLVAGSGEGPHATRTRRTSSERTWTSHQARRLPDLGLTIERLGAVPLHADDAIWASSVPRLDLDVWLVHARSDYAAINFSNENTVSRVNR